MSRVIYGALCAVACLFPTVAAWAEDGLATETTTAAAATEPAAVPTPDQPPTVAAEIVVTASRIEIPLQQNPAATAVVSEAELAAMPRAVAIDEALKLVPGVKVDNQLNGEKVHLSIRGQGILTERGIRGIKVLLDGLPLNDPTGFAPDLYDVDWATVDRVEVLRGPASAMYGGGASGGILSIETRDGGDEPVGGTVHVAGGSNGFWKVLTEAGGTTEGGLDYRVSASRAAADGYRVHSAFDATNLYSKLGLYDGPAGHITAIVAGTSYFMENPEGLNIDQVEIDPTLPNLGGAREGAEVVSDQVIRQSSWGLWAMDRLSLGHDLTLVLGARRDDIDNRLDDKLDAGGIDRSGDTSFAETTGRVGLAWSPRPELGLYTSWGSGFLPPATEELANNPANPGGFNQGLVAATSDGVEVGARGALSDRFSYDVALFHLATDDDFGRYRISERPLETFYRNAGDSTRYGVETLLTWFPVDPLAVRLAYTYSHFTYDRVAIGEEVFHDTRLPNAPDHQAYLDLAGNLGGGFVAGAAAEWVSSWYIDGSNATSVDGYTLLNARLGYRFRGRTWSGEVLLSGRNLTDEQWIAFTEPDPDGNSYQPGPGRRVSWESY